MYLIIHTIAIDIMTIVHTGFDFLDGGIIIAMNIAYNAIPIAPLRLGGRRLDAHAPKSVPNVQPQNGPVISPYIYEADNALGSVAARAKVSSVIPKLKISLCNIEVFFSTFCERESDIRKYRRLIINVLSVISNKVPP